MYAFNLYAFGVWARHMVGLLAGGWYSRRKLGAAADCSSGGGSFIFFEGKIMGGMDFQVKSNGRIQAVTEDGNGTPLAVRL